MKQPETKQPEKQQPEKQQPAAPPQPSKVEKAAPKPFEPPPVRKKPERKPPQRPSEAAQPFEPPPLRSKPQPSPPPSSQPPREPAPREPASREPAPPKAAPPKQAASDEPAHDRPRTHSRPRPTRHGHDDHLPPAEKAAEKPAAPPERAPKPAAKDYTTPDHQNITTADEPGGVVWRYPVFIPGQGVPSPPLRGCVAVDLGKRLYAAIGRKVVALHEEEGELRRLWEFSTGANIPGSPVLGGDGRIRVHSGDGLLHCLSETGEPAWPSLKLGEPLGWAAPVTDEEGATWICNYSGGLIKVDARGQRQGDVFFRTRQRFDSTGFVYRETLFIGAEDGFVYAISLDGRRGKNLWDPLTDQGKTDWFINSAPAMTSDRVIVVAGRDEYLHAFNLDGDQLWKLHLRGQMLASPVVAPGGDIYVGVSLERRGASSWGKLICVDGQSHQERWEYRADGPIESTPVLGDDGVVYFGDNKGFIHGVGADGAMLWKTQVGAAVRSAGTIPQDNRLVFGLDNGTLVALNCSSTSLPEKGWPKYMRSANQSGLA